MLNPQQEQEIFFKLDKGYQDSIIQNSHELGLKINKTIDEIKNNTSKLADVLLKYEDKLDN